MTERQTVPEAFVDEPARRTPVVRDVDVLVVGGGTSGCAAAVAAARRGLRVALLDRYGFLGGTATAAMVGCLCGVYTCSPNTVTVVRGYLAELTDRLEARKSGYKLKHRYQLDHEVLKLILDGWLRDAGVELFFQTQMVSTLVEGATVCGVVIETKAGRGAIRARVVIDSTGDADVVANAGGAYEKSPTSLLQAPSLVFTMAGVDIERATRLPEAEVSRLLRAATESGEFAFNRFSGGFSPVPPDGKVHMNITRITDVDATDPDDLSRAYLEGRRQIEEYARFALKYLPGFEAAYIDQIAPQLGIRETRRAVGEYQLTVDDVLGARSFPDAICRGAWPVEIHPNDGTGTTRIHLEGDTYYQIPYRCLVTRDLEGLLVTGRCMSTSHEAHGSTRVMGTGIASGQAAGTAAALAVLSGRSPRRVDVSAVQAELEREGALL
jgi:ribulose 1,5-bisphosphate synthetase/thiazole synthase